MKPFSQTHVRVQILKNLLTLENVFFHIRFHHMILKATMGPTNDFAKVGVPPGSYIKENYGVKNLDMDLMPSRGKKGMMKMHKRVIPCMFHKI